MKAITEELKQLADTINKNADKLEWSNNLHHIQQELEYVVNRVNDIMEQLDWVNRVKLSREVY